MACGSCGIGPHGFGKRNRRRSRSSMKAAMKALDELKKLKELGKNRRVTRKRSRKARRSRGRSRRSRSRSRSRSRKARRSRSRSRRFGTVIGPGYEGLTSYSNAYTDYFGQAEPFINASNWWYPYSNGVAQSPQMLMKM